MTGPQTNDTGEMSKTSQRASWEQGNGFHVPFWGLATGTLEVALQRGQK